MSLALLVSMPMRMESIASRGQSESSLTTPSNSPTMTGTGDCKRLTRIDGHAVIGFMELTREQRRALLALCCVVARADGSVSSAEYERLLELLSRLAQGALGFSELETWMQKGPPELNVRLPEECIRFFLREAISLARADGKLEDIEIATIKDLVQRYFEAPTT